MATQTKPSTPSTPAQARSYKNVVISLGAFTTFPAKLIAAAREETSGLRLAVVEGNDAKPVTQLYTADNQNYFPIGQLGRAVEIGDKLVPVTPEERASLKVGGSKAIEITKFVNLYDVDPVFMANSYVIAPDTDSKSAGNPQAANLYHLMLTVMVNKDLVGMAKMTDRDKEYNVIIRPSFDGLRLMLHTMYTSNEVRNIAIAAPTVEFSDAHMKMGYKLIESLKGEFDPNGVTSESDNRLAALIARKTAEANGMAPTPEAPQAASTGNAADDLLAKLSASLYATGNIPTDVPTTKPVATETKPSRRKKVAA